MDENKHIINCKLIDGKKEGPGSIIFNENDNLCGKTLTKGSELKGVWKNNYLDGEAFYIDKNKSHWKANIKNNKLHGILTYYYANGKIMYTQKWIDGNVYGDDELHWNDLKKDIIKSEINFPKEINLKISMMYTGVASYFIGDAEIIKDIYDKGGDLEDLIDSVSLNENYKINSKIINFFSLNTHSDQNTYYYWAEKNKKLDFLFIPTLLFYQIGAQADNANIFKNNNKKFIKEIINFIDPNNTSWRRLGKIELPNSQLYIGETNMAGLNYDEIDHKITLPCNHKEYEIFSIIADRKKLLEIYNNKYDEFNYVNEEILYETNEHLPKDKVFHGIILLGNN